MKFTTGNKKNPEPERGPEPQPPVERASTPVGRKASGGNLRNATVIIGFIIVVVGCYSHFSSSWVRTDIPTVGDATMKPYEFCEFGQIKKCPNICMERYFVSMIIISFLLSMGGLIAYHVVDLKKGLYLKIDVGLHIITAVLLLVGAILYIVSAQQINNLLGPLEGLMGFHFRRLEKLGAACFAIIQASLFGLIALHQIKS